MVSILQQVGLMLLMFPILMSIKGMLKYLAWMAIVGLGAALLMHNTGMAILFLIMIPCVYVATERGLKLSYYRRFLNLGMLLVMLPFMLMGMSMIPGMNKLRTSTELMDQSFSFTWITLVYWGFTGLIVLLLLGSLLGIIYVLVLSRCLRSGIELAERFTLLVFISYMTLLAMPYIYGFGIHLLNVKAIVPAIFGLSLCISVLFSWRVSRLFPVFNPVSFSRQNKTLEFLKQSFSYHDLKPYAEFTIEYLNQLNPKYRIGFIGTTFSSGLEFGWLDENGLNQIHRLVERTDARLLNIDLEILNDTVAAEHLKDFELGDMPHVIFPIRRDNGKILALLMFGKMPGIYWPRTLVEAIKDIVEIFESFYVSILYNIEVKEHEVKLSQEQNTRLYQEQLNSVVKAKNLELEAEKKRIMDSIQYASIIQRSILPPQQALEGVFSEVMVIWKPRDIVGGDFYWMHQGTSELHFACVDCTGHGVPGALMSIAASSALEQIVGVKRITDPSLILHELHRIIGESLHQNMDSAIQDGMDIALIRYKEGKVSFAGAKQSILIYSPYQKTLTRVRGNKSSVGGLRWQQETDFNTVELDFAHDSSIYFYSDGITDQPTGNGRKLGNVGFQKLLVGLAGKDLKSQETDLQDYLEGILEFGDQRDDITIIGLKLYA